MSGQLLQYQGLSENSGEQHNGQLWEGQAETV